MKRHLTISLLLHICLLGLYAQPYATGQEAVVLTRYARNIINFNREHPQEKVYLHMDNRSYYIGDTIWFKAYVMDATTLHPTETSGVLYVELLNDFGGEIAHRKLQIKNGMCHGEFPLDSTCRTGFYEIRAYTRNMLNVEDDATWSEIWSESFHAKNDGAEIHSPSSIAYPDAIVLQKDGTETNHGKVSKQASQRISFPKAYSMVIVESPPKVHGIDRRESALKVRDKRREIRDRGVPLINEYIFSRVFPVFMHPDSAGQYKQVMEVYPPHPALAVNDKPAKPRPVVNFYPEGGVLIRGVESKVALEVRMKEFRESERYGYRTSAIGVVEDNWGNVVDTFETDKRGRAVITLLPNKGRSYTATVYFADGGKARRFPIEPIEPQGYAIALEPPVGMSDLAFTVHASPYNSKRKQSTIGWTLQCRGAVTAYDTVTVLPGSSKVLTIPRAQLRGGVNQLSLYNADGLVVADRLFWVNPSEAPATVTVTGMPDSIQPFERVTLDLQVGDTSRLGRHSMLSLSVTDAADRFGNYDTRNLWSDMLLSSDLKGFIDDVDSYFAHDTEEAMAADIDRLMLVQGWRWRRYEWHTMAGSVPYKQKYTPEKGLVIDGYVIKDQPYETRLYKLSDVNAYTRVPNLQVDATIRSNSFFLHRITHSNSQADFSIPLDTVFYGEVPLTLMLTDTISSDSKRIEKTFIPLYRAFSPPPHSYSYYQTNFTDFLDVSGVDRTHKVVRKDLLHNGVYIFRPEHIIDYAKEWNTVIDMGVPRRNFGLSGNLYDTEEYPEKSYMIPQLHYHLYRLSNTADIVFRNNPFLDKYNANAPIVKSYSTRYVMPEKIYLYGNRYRRHDDFGEVSNGTLPFNYAIIEYAKESPRRPPFFPSNGVRETYFEGYSVSHEFYSPDYSECALPDSADYRRTLYWNPNVETDNQGRASVSFYNNARTTHLHIQAEGITQGGGFVVYDSGKN